MPQLTLQLVTYNNEKFLPEFFDSLQKQTFKDWELKILDNGSSDQTKNILYHYSGLGNMPLELVNLSENSGFSGGHNILFKKADTPYVGLLNPDIYLTSNCLEKLITYLHAAPTECAVVTPRLMKWNFLEKKFTDQIDSLGLKVLRNRRVIEWYQGQSWSEVGTEFNNQSAIEVFGVSGTLPLFRRSALLDTQEVDGSIFDPRFGSYKEDVDLAFRLQSRGYRAHVVLDAVAYHVRRASGKKSLDDISASKNKATQPIAIQQASYRNHLYVLYKNEYGQNFILDFFWILWYEVKKLVYFLLFDRAVLKGLQDFWNNRKLLKQSRAHIKKLRNVNWKALRTWWK
jgi:GT2 family glycosyltransferase